MHVALHGGLYLHSHTSILYMPYEICLSHDSDFKTNMHVFLVLSTIASVFQLASHLSLCMPRAKFSVKDAAIIRVILPAT